DAMARTLRRLRRGGPRPGHRDVTPVAVLRNDGNEASLAAGEPVARAAPGARPSACAATAVLLWDDRRYTLKADADARPPRGGARYRRLRRLRGGGDGARALERR